MNADPVKDALQKLGEATAAQLCRATDLRHEQVYAALVTLHDRGLAPFAPRKLKPWRSPKFS